MVYIRLIANKLVEMQESNDLVKNYLAENTDWEEYVNNDLQEVNKIERKPLGSDPRK